MIILCSSLRSPTGETILQTIDSLKLSQSILLAIDVSSFIPFLPKIVNNLNKKKDDLEQDFFQNDAPFYESVDSTNQSSSKLMNFKSAPTSFNYTKNTQRLPYSNALRNETEEFGTRSTDSNYTAEIVFEADNSTLDVDLTGEYYQKKNETFKSNNAAKSEYVPLIRKKRNWPQDRYEMFENISLEMKKSFMILTSIDSKNPIADVFVVNATPKNELYEHILEGLHTVMSGSSDNKTHKVFKFLFLEWIEDGEDSEGREFHWRPLIILQSSKNASWPPLNGIFQQSDSLSNLVKVQPNFDDWFKDRGMEYDEDACDGDFCIRAQIKMNSTHIIIIVASALIFTFATIGVALIVRYVKKYIFKSPFCMV